MKWLSLKEIIKCKIKGDAGIYGVWAIDWLEDKVFVERACGHEWVSMDKVKMVSPSGCLLISNTIQIED